MKILQTVFGSKTERNIKRNTKLLSPLLHAINSKQEWAAQCSHQDMLSYTETWRKEIQNGTSLDNKLVECFALAREASRRVLGEYPYDVQIMGAVALHQGKIIEMKTGEGKTLCSVAPAYLNALAGKGVHIVTVNDYLAERDAHWMGPVFEYLGISVGYILPSMSHIERKNAYKQDVTYGTNNEFGFDYLRDNMCYEYKQQVQQGHSYCIIDEIDSILIDEARTPLIISGQASDNIEKYRDVNKCVFSLHAAEKDAETGEYPENPTGDYTVDEKSRKVSFTDNGLNHLESILVKKRIINGSIFESHNLEYIHYATQALRAHTMFHKDQQYVVQNGRVEIVDEFTGRILHGRRYSDGLHQALEAKEGIQVAARNKTLATITFQNFFRMYEKISGMTGTAETEEQEFGKIYALPVVVIPTNRPIARIDYDDVIYVSEQAKYKAICNEIVRIHETQQPILVGTISIERSEQLSRMLQKRGIKHEVLNAKNHAREAAIIAEAGAKGAITIATNMAGRGTDIKLGGNPEFRVRQRVSIQAGSAEYHNELKKEKEKWQKEYEEVCALGGLYILGTERHESRRIDNQLRGRSGRQGDTGMSRFYISMDDDLMRLFGGGKFNLKALMERSMEPDEPLKHPLINRTLERAQHKVEERNFDIRKHLLEYDDVVNEQRKVIYEQRKAIRNDGNVIQRIYATASDVLDEAAADIEFPITIYHIDKILLSLRETLLFSPASTFQDFAGLSREEFHKKVFSEMRNELSLKENVIGTEHFNLVLRMEYLRTIDEWWQNHLENLEELREAVYLRGYAQKNPLLEYKLEGFQIFDEMLSGIRIMIAKRVFALKITREHTYTPEGTGAVQSRALHQNIPLFQNAAQQKPAVQQASARFTTHPQTEKKVGRNTPCPCGSGKKYKHCHGR